MPTGQGDVTTSATSTNARVLPERRSTPASSDLSAHANGGRRLPFVRETKPLQEDLSRHFHTLVLLLTGHLNFFRIHLLFFITVPLIASGIFFATDRSNNSYIDCLTLCYSIMTVTGLNPIAMSNITYGQCAILYVLTIIGSTSFVALVTVVVRQYYFLQRFKEVIISDRQMPRQTPKPVSSHLSRVSGLTQKVSKNLRRTVTKGKESDASLHPADIEAGQPGDATRAEWAPSSPLSKPGAAPNSSTTPLQLSARPPMSAEIATSRLARSDSPYYSGPSRNRHAFVHDGASLGGQWQSVKVTPSPAGHIVHDHQGRELVRTYSRNPKSTSLTKGFGGFSNPIKRWTFQLVHHVVHRHIPGGQTHQVVALQSNRRTSSDPKDTFPPLKVTSSHSSVLKSTVNYISFDALVGRNSKFLGLTSEQRDELGGVEYRALSVLKKVVLAYFLLIQLIPMAIFCPLFSSKKYAPVLENGGVPASDGAFMAAFTVSNAYTNSGLTLFNGSMAPVQDVYGWVIMVSLLILAGNVAFPMILRFVIWTLSKIVPKHSQTHESLTFLLDHPRRCFFYLFPSFQTWFLVVLLILFNGFDMVCWALFDRGLPIWNNLTPAKRLLHGYFQSIATRAAGFTMLPLRQFAASQQLVILVMMYISVYPNAISIRSTNVYEERSLGIVHPNNPQQLEDGQFDPKRPHRPFKYLASHLRRQLAFDVYFLLAAIWIICISERTRILNTEDKDYFTIFAVIFETVSGYGTVGLSLGTPQGPYSLCHEWAVLSKLMLCAVMVRGRHRDLPEAIDRSVLLPSDIEAMAPKSQVHVAP